MTDKEAYRILALAATGGRGFMVPVLTSSEATTVHVSVVPDYDGERATLTMIACHQRDGIEIVVCKKGANGVEECESAAADGLGCEIRFDWTSKPIHELSEVIRARSTDALLSAIEIAERSSMADLH